MRHSASVYMTLSNKRGFQWHFQRESICSTKNPLRGMYNNNPHVLCAFGSILMNNEVNTVFWRRHPSNTFYYKGTTNSEVLKERLVWCPWTTLLLASLVAHDMSLNVSSVNKKKGRYKGMGYQYMAPIDVITIDYIYIIDWELFGHTMNDYRAALTGRCFIAMYRWLNSKET